MGEYTLSEAEEALRIEAAARRAKILMSIPGRVGECGNCGHPIHYGEQRRYVETSHWRRIMLCLECRSSWRPERETQAARVEVLG